MLKKINELRLTIRENRPLIHSITNPITMNQCANAVLAVGARPIMAEHPMEVEQITKTAKALTLNLGNISESRMEAIRISSELAGNQNIPIVLDAVGVACSSLRRVFASELIKKNCPDIIKGNYSEIKALLDAEYCAEGVDSEKINIEEICNICIRLARRHNSVILASGAWDIISNGENIAIIKNGCSQMSKITGTGCILGALCGCYITAGNAFWSAVTACAVLGICGELSYTDAGSGSFFVNLLDNLSVLTDEIIDKKLRIEVRNTEEV